VRNVLFENNSAMAGGAMYNLPNVSGMADIEGHRSNVRVVGVTFLRNYAEKRGGAVIDNLGASPTFVDTVFQDNECADKGGAVYDDFRSSPQFYNVLFSGNKAFRGAALANDGGSNPILKNATFVNNEAEDVGAGLYQGTGGSPNEPTVVASVVWGNTAEQGPGNVYDWHHSRVHFVRSAVEGGGGGVDVAPEFQDPHAGSYALVEGSKLAQLGIGYDPKRSGASLVGSVKSMAGPPTDETKSAPAWRPTGVLKGAVHVTETGAGKRDGSSWGDALASVQAAIDLAARKRAQVWIAEGTYVPSGTGRSASFRLADGVAIYGGFAGDESSPDQRDPRGHATVLSGDLGRKGDVADNAYHVLEGANGVLLDGLTIRDGNADGALYDGRGGGLVSYDEHTRTLPGRSGEGFTDVVIEDVTFRNNRAKEGGALYAFGTSSIGFDRVRFEGNAADYGGALVLRVDVDASFERTTFTDNRATWQGGAAYLDYGVRPTFVDCAFSGNQAGSHGGAVYLTTRASQVEETRVAFDGCTFEGNRSGGRGGAISNFDQGRLDVVRSSFDDNAAALGGGAVATDRESTTELSQVSVGTNRGGKGEPDLEADRTSRYSLR
jgi:predicted outer membrane repeat protein